MKAVLFAALTFSLLPLSTSHVKNDHANVTVFDIFELSPEQFATMMSKSDQ
jgi:hypothetical protein